MSVTLSCLAVELFLKSKLDMVEHDVRLETSHDIIGIYRILTTKFTDTQRLTKKIGLLRKYYNDSRYPATGTAIYTSGFAEEFLSYVSEVKQFIDTDCLADINDLTKKFGKP